MCRIALFNGTRQGEETLVNNQGGEVSITRFDAQPETLTINDQSGVASNDTWAPGLPGAPGAPGAVHFYLYH